MAHFPGPCLLSNEVKLKYLSSQAHLWKAAGKKTSTHLLWSLPEPGNICNNLLLSFGASLVAQTVKPLCSMEETRVWSLGQKDPLEKEMATHSSILAWKIPGTEEPAGLLSMGSYRVGHYWSDLEAAAAVIKRNSRDAFTKFRITERPPKV